MMRFGVADEKTADGYGKYIHLCRSNANESARSRPATRCLERGAMAVQAPKAPSTWNQKPFLRTQVRQPGKIIDGAGVRGARNPDHADRSAGILAVGLDRRAERREVDLHGGVHRDPPQGLAPKPEHFDGLLDRGVGFVEQ